MTDEVLTLSHVSVRFPGKVVLDDVSFTLGAGEVTGLIGPNGSGKTTLLRVILGLQPMAGGSVVFGRSRAGEGGGKRRVKHLREGGVGYVPQKFLLDPDLPLRARDVVSLGLDGDRFGFRLPSRQRTELVDAALESVGATAFARSRVGSLSGGEQQRVLIAHALISKPRLLLLDEPLANLDPGSAEEVVSLVDRLAGTEGIAVFISAHEMNTLLPAMDGVVYLANGRVASGTVEEVIRADVLTKLYGHHVDVLHLHGRVLVVAGVGADDVVDLHDITVLPDKS